VERQELVYFNTPTDTEVFGYQERFAEYRYKPSLITGEFRPGLGSGFDQWHLAQNLGSPAVLGQTFIEEDVPTSRVKATSTDPDFLLDMFFNYRCARPMPVYSVPGLVDHF